MSFTPAIPPSWISSLPNAIWDGANGLIVFPYLSGQEVTINKGQTWSTKVVYADSGRRRATPHWTFPLWTFEVSYEVIRHRPTNDELAKMYEFFGLAQGQYGLWLFVDPSDCQILSSAPTTFGVGDGVTTVFQLGRSINTFFEPIYAVYDATILDNGSPAGTNTIGADGVVTFTTAPSSGHALSWYGYWYFLCAFDQDDMTFDQIVNLLWSGKSLKFKSQRP